MPELPEIESLAARARRAVSVAPVERAGPAHIATLKTFDPPFRRSKAGASRARGRRGKHFLFPTEDGELVLHIHLMSAGRLHSVAAGGKRPKTPAFRALLRGRRHPRAHRGRREEAGPRRASTAPRRSRPSSPTSARRRSGSGGLGSRILSPKLAAPPSAAARPAGARGHRPGVVERDPPSCRLSPMRSPPSSTAEEVERLAAAIDSELDPRARAARTRAAGREGLPDPRPSRPAVP